MNAPAFGTLDHVGIAVADLERGRTLFDRLGFRLTSRSVHAGARTPGGPVEPWGSGNHCAMFRRGYLEILGVIDPQKFSNARDMVARYEGAHIVAFGCESADATCAALRHRGVVVDEPRQLQRNATYGEDDDQERLAVFRNLYLDRETYPEARFLYIEHRTHEVLWQPHLLAHPNGVCDIREVVICTAEGEADGVAAKLARVTGSAPEPIGGGEWRLPLQHAALRVVSPHAWARQLPGVAVPPLPAPVGVVFGVDDLARTHSFFMEREIMVTTDARGRLWLQPALAGGAALCFVGTEKEKV